MESISNCISLGMQYCGNDIAWIKPRKNRFYGLGPPWTWANFRVTKKGKVQTTRERHFTHVPRRPLWGDHFYFWHVGWCRLYVITHAKFYVNRFRGFGVLTTPISPISIRLAGRPYNSESTTVLHLSLIHIWRCRRIERCRSRWSPYH